jgi:hypothetical protein
MSCFDLITNIEQCRFLRDLEGDHGRGNRYQRAGSVAIAANTGGGAVHIREVQLFSTFELQQWCGAERLSGWVATSSGRSTTGIVGLGLMRCQLEMSIGI